MQCEGKKVVFITPASKVEKVNFYVKADREALSELGFIVEELDVSVEETAVIQEKISTCDCVFVEGSILLNGEYSSLGAINFCIVPHYSNPPFKKAAERIVREYNDFLALYPISNNQAVVVDGGNIEVITA